MNTTFARIGQAANLLATASAILYVPALGTNDLLTWHFGEEGGRDPMTSVLVLGANGYVGGAIVAAVAKSGRLRPIASGRHTSNRFAQASIETRICDATDAIAMSDAARGVSYIVNSVLGDEATMLAATRNVCNAARQHNVNRIIHVSSMEVYGSATGLVDEATALDMAASPYGAAKIACEGVVSEYIAQGGDAVILRPGIVHGPGGQQWTGRLGRMLRLRRLGDLGALGDGRCNLTYIDDLGAAAVASIERTGVRGASFNVADADPPTWNQYLIALAVLIGAGPVRRLSGRRARLESKLLAPPLQVLKLLSAKLGVQPGRLPEPIPPSLLRLFGHDMALDHRKADQHLGFKRTRQDVAMNAAAAWFRAAHGIRATG